MLRNILFCANLIFQLYQSLGQTIASVFEKTNLSLLIVVFETLAAFVDKVEIAAFFGCVVFLEFVYFAEPSQYVTTVAFYNVVAEKF
uniref:Putative secreted protein n=1 Tax=Panstrongylus lignarius TaxID=156445 RepID=A0A224Y2L8_9HEMI